MLHTLWVEWLKIRRYRTFWVLMTMTLLSIPGATYLAFDMTNNSFPKGRGKAILGSPFAFPDAWQTVAWNSTLLFILPAILIITLITNEFTYKTHRQNIIDGWSRGQWISVKLLEVLILAVKCTAMVFVTTLIFGCWVNKVPAGVGIWQDSRFLFFYFVQALSYLTIAFLISLLVKRAGLAIGIFLIYLLGEEIVVDVSLHIYKFNGLVYLPEEVTDQLVPRPYLRKILVTPAEMSKWEHHLPVFLAVAALYLVIYCVIAGRRFKTSDL